MPRSSGYSYHAPGAGANLGNGGPDVDVKVKQDIFSPVEMVRFLLLLLLMYSSLQFRGVCTPFVGSLVVHL